ncbi:hypothetical protein VTO42DRAFT_6331 [Malbranchea cinnamomea]
MKPSAVSSSNHAPFTHTTTQAQSSTRAGEREEIESAEDTWSGQESSNEAADQKSSQPENGLKRKRPITVSCETCKIRKVKCDRAQPACGWCARNSQACVYKERKKPGLRAGYGKELEQRLDRLEAIIQSQARIIETHILQAGSRNHQELHHDAPSYSSPSEPSAAHGPSPRGFRSHDRSSSISVTHQTPGTVHFQHDPSLASPPDANARSMIQPAIQSGISPTSVLSQPVDSTMRQTDYTHNDSSLQMPVSLYADRGQSFPDPDNSLPPYDLLYALVDLYFEHINTWCPILHRRTTLDTFFGPNPLEEEDRILLYAIVATTLRFSTDPRLNEENRKRYHDTAKQKVLMYGLDNSSVTALQALVILALDFVGSSNGPPGWKLLALIARSVVQMGLSVESTSSLLPNMFPSIYTLRANVLPDARTWIEDESRRRLFWMVYLLDRYSTVATAFDFALDDKEIERKLPCKEEFFTRNQPVETRWFEVQERTDYLTARENVGSFGFYMEVIGILSRIHLFLKQPVDIGSLSDVEQWQSTYKKLDNELTTWLYHLPKEYAFDTSSRIFNVSKNSRSVHCGWVMLHASYQTAVIRLHSSAAYPTTRSPIFTPSYSASQRCLAAVDNILALTRFVVDNNVLDNLGPPFAFTLWVSARLLLVHGSTIAHTVNPEINFFVSTLRRMGKYWKVAERYSNILQRVLDEYAEYEQAAGTTNERVTPSSVKILADMRRCAFDLDFLISRQPRNQLTVANTPRVAATPARNLGPNDFEYLDVFGFFNVPRIPTAPVDGAGGVVNNTSGANGISTLAPVSDLSSGQGGVADTAVPMTNEFNITNYMIPTPETDWLFRNATT